ncbi:MAG: YfhO family protein [Anaerolineae bacterium]|nr:YfhO family protein [Anaerolineae bacterium]MDW8172903.1 YfhO family protein [Anaerolineae bacterium]
MKQGLVILSLVALCGLFFWRVLTPHAPDRLTFAEGDFTQHFYSFVRYHALRWHSGTPFPQWNPYNHAGDPFLANVQFAVFYPPRWLTLTLLGADGLTQDEFQLEVIAHYALASITMFAFLRVVTSSSTSGVIGGVLYAYSGFMVGYPMLQPSILSAMAWLPLVLLGVHQSVHGAPSQALRWLVLGSISLALAVLAGHPQTAVQIGYLSAIYLAFSAYRARLSLWQAAWRLLLLGGLALALSAAQVLPTLEFIRTSYRATVENYAEKSLGFGIQQWLQVFLPGQFGIWSPLYLGVVGGVLGLVGLATARGAARLWLVLVVLGLWLSLGAGSFLYDAAYLGLPLASWFRQQERIANVVVFGLIMLACEALDRILRGQTDAEANAWQRGLWAFSAAGLGLALLTHSLRSSEDDALVQTLLTTAAHGAVLALWYAWQRSYGGTTWQKALPLLGLIVLDLFTFGTRSPNFVPNDSRHAPHIPGIFAPLATPIEDIRWRVDGASGLRGYAVLAQVPDIYGTGPISLESIASLRTLPVDRMWEVLSVRYVSTSDTMPQGLAFRELAQDVNDVGEVFRLYELLDPRPLAHLVYDARTALDNPLFARQIMSDPRVNLREMAVTLAPIPLDLPVTPPELREVTALETGPERWSMRVATGANALLTVSLPYYNGWRASIDGQDVPIIPTYVGLISVPLRPGEHDVVLEFSSPTAQLGVTISGLALALSVGVLALGKRFGLGQTLLRPGEEVVQNMG